MITMLFDTTYTCPITYVMCSLIGLGEDGQVCDWCSEIDVVLYKRGLRANDAAVCIRDPRQQHRYVPAYPW